MRRASVVAMAIAVTAAVCVAALPAAAQDSSTESEVLRFGWAQDPKTLNPFIGQDEEDFTIWAITYELLINFDPEDLSPTPGIAESWEVSEDRKTITFNLIKGAKWSDGKPITSEDVKWSLEVLGSEGYLFSSYTQNVAAIKTPDENTVVLEMSKPDARVIGGLFIYVLPKHVWEQVPVKELTGAYEPEIPLVGSGPYVPTQYDRGRIVTMERNPEWRGEEPAFDELQFIKYGSNDAVERALTLGEIDIITEVQPATFERLGEEDGIETLRAPTASFTQLSFNLCSEKDCPDAQFNPAVQDLDVRQAIAYGIDRERINEIATQGTSFVAHGLLPSFYKSFFEIPEQDYPYDPEMANQILDDAGLGPGRRRGPREGRRPAGVRPLRAFGIAVHGSDGEADRRADGGDRGQVQRPGRKHGQALRAHRAQGRRRAGAGLRHLHLGLGRGPLRSGLPAQPADYRRDRCLLGCLLLEPGVRPALRGADDAVRHRGAQGGDPGDDRDHAA